MEQNHRNRNFVVVVKAYNCRNIKHIQNYIILCRICLFLAPPTDPNAPKPEGSTLSPVAGDQLVVRICSYIS